MENTEKFFGKVIFFKHNFGFASWQKAGVDQKDIFIHYSDIINQNGYRTLRKGQKISFDLGLNHNGDLKAINVSVEEA